MNTSTKNGTKQHSIEKSQNRDKSYLLKIQSNHNKQQTAVNKKEVGVKVNPDLLIPILKAVQQGLNPSSMLAKRPIKKYKTRNLQDQQPIKSLKRPPSGEKTVQNISILSGIHPLHSHKHSWNISTNIQSVKNQDKSIISHQRTPSQTSISNQKAQRSFHHKQNDSLNLCSSCQKNKAEIGYLMLDLQQSNEKSRQSSMGRGFSNGDVEQKRKKRFKIMQSQEYSGIKEKKITTVPEQIYSTKSSDRRQRFSSQHSTDFLQKLASRVKSTIGKQSQSITFNLNPQTDQQDTYSKQKELLKIKSESRLEQLKQEMKQSLHEYRRSKERLKQDSKTIISTDGKVVASTFAQSVLNFSDKIEKLIKDQRKSQVRVQQQQTAIDIVKQNVQKRGESQNFKRKVIAAADKENNVKQKKNCIIEVQQNKPNTFNEIKVLSMKDMNAKQKLINSRALNQKNRNDNVPNYIRRTVIDIESSCSSSDYSTQDEVEKSIDLPKQSDLIEQQ